MNLHTPTRTAQRHKQKIFGDLTRVNDTKFWLVVFLQDLEKVAALDRVLKRTYKNRAPDIALQYGLIEAIRHFDDELKKHVEYLMKEGQLLFAFAGTKAVALESEVLA